MAHSNPIIPLIFRSSYGPHLLHHLPSNGACLTGGQVAVVAVSQVEAHFGQFPDASILDDNLRECCRWVYFILQLKTLEESENVFNDGNRENIQKVKKQLVGYAELSFRWKNVVEFAEVLLYILIKKYEIVSI